MSRVSTSDGRAYLCPGTPGQVLASMDWTWDHPMDQIGPSCVGQEEAEDTDMSGSQALNVIELGHGSRLEQRRNGDLYLITLTSETKVEGATDSKSLQEALAKLGVYQVPVGTANWFSSGEGFSSGTVSTATQPIGLAPVGPFQPDVKMQQEDLNRPRAGVGDQDMAGNTLQPARDNKAPPEEEAAAKAPAPAPVATLRTTPDVQATKGQTAQPTRPGTRKG